MGKGVILCKSSKKSMKTSTFYQDGVTKVGFTHPHITNKNLYRIHEIMVFEILDIK